MLSTLAGIDAAGWAGVGAGIGVGLCVLGAGLGIGNIGGNATQATARQPEASGQVFLQMLIAAALIEGVAFFGVITAGGVSSKAIDADTELQSHEHKDGEAFVKPEGDVEFVLEEGPIS